jgi:hypothetical protein
MPTLDAPEVGLQQAIVNEVNYLDDLLNGSSNVSQVLSEISGHLQTVLSAITLDGASSATLTTVENHTLDLIHQALAQSQSDWARQRSAGPPASGIPASPASSRRSPVVAHGRLSGSRNRSPSGAGLLNYLRAQSIPVLHW